MTGEHKGRPRHIEVHYALLLGKVCMFPTPGLENVQTAGGFILVWSGRVHDEMDNICTV